MGELDSVLKPYTSHKKVRAVEITSVSEVKDGLVYLTFAGTLTMPWAEQMFHRYLPVAGDFFVQYDNDYVSVSPRKQFIDGYKADGESFADIKKRVSSAPHPSDEERN